jgi:hypothetical protein
VSWLPRFTLFACTVATIGCCRYLHQLKFSSHPTLVVFALVAVVASGAATIVQGCGSDPATVDTEVQGDSGSDAAFAEDTSIIILDSSVGDGSVGDGGVNQCFAIGQACTTGAQCCSSSCDATLKVCSRGGGGAACKVAAAACATPTECCSLVCNAGKCGAAACVSDNQACQVGADCCGGKCDAGKCTPLNAVCKTGGNSCTASGECCSKLCKSGVCSIASSICSQPGDVCGGDNECCTGMCTKAAGNAVGVCALASSIGGGGASSCVPAGVVCGTGVLADGGAIVACTGAGTDCCSRSCLPYANTGVTICQPATGCRPTGEICRADVDCCGANGVAGAGGQSVTCLKANAADPVGRCTNGQACRGNGQVCKLVNYQCAAENNCCAGNVNQVPTACKQDNLGIPRCTFAGTCGATPGIGPNGTQLAGAGCASSADCCGLPCVPNPAGTPPYVCGAACVAAAGGCTTTADCCGGLACTLQPGSTRGTCGTPPGGVGSDGGVNGDGGLDGGRPPACIFYGQTCTGATPCCDDVTCSGGRCQVTN